MQISTFFGCLGWKTAEIHFDFCQPNELHREQVGESASCSVLFSFKKKLSDFPAEKRMLSISPLATVSVSVISEAEWVIQTLLSTQNTHGTHSIWLHYNFAPH